MPSGRTHDRITLWSLPIVAGLTHQFTHDSHLTLLVSGSYLFSGLMFGPDLDIYSRQYRRWGVLRWIWLPYQRGMRHRSPLSHGPLLGTALRVVYLLTWLAGLGLLTIVLIAIGHQVTGRVNDWQRFAQSLLSQGTTVLGQGLQQYPQLWIAVLIGLELGAMSHSLSDWGGSTWKRTLRRYRKSPNRKPPTKNRTAPDTPISEEPSPDRPVEFPPTTPDRPARREPQLPILPPPFDR